MTHSPHCCFGFMSPVNEANPKYDIGASIKGGYHHPPCMGLMSLINNGLKFPPHLATVCLNGDDMGF